MSLPVVRRRWLTIIAICRSSEKTHRKGSTAATLIYRRGAPAPDSGRLGEAAQDDPALTARIIGALYRDSMILSLRGRGLVRGEGPAASREGVPA
jgi:hypothetical protein